ncbi:preprotein translocase subunit SecG [Rhizorhapis suberifaciens]|uniref:Protein-export membrane protein SecG n=1 Tax=Rhizorhapis suberifaciens TaxID=13656 RepID=A0A840HVF4_9SPHN|nr:preprotein translocase subunit SecG [Rhizorhapis suberifaciens]MBB4642272.1 preprotein translocase subunit SecG [Rhizorhapis suberifaciens]
MFTFILVVQAIVAAVLVGVILMQRSEGGGLGVGGSPSGLMSARGAADFLTRSTTILATLFVGLSVLLAVIASVKHAPASIDTSLSRSGTSSAPANDVPVAGGDPLAAAADKAAQNESAPKDEGVPLAR